MAWYVSLTLRWANQKGDSLASFMDYCSKVQIPNDRIRLPQSCWHSTLYAFAKIERIFYPHENMRNSALFVLNKLRKTPIVEAMSKLPQFRFRPVALKHLAKDTTIQFEEKENRIEALRKSLSTAVRSINLHLKRTTSAFHLTEARKTLGISSGVQLLGIQLTVLPTPCSSYCEFPRIALRCLRPKRQYSLFQMSHWGTRSTW